MKHDNPFFFGGVVEEEDFCDREDELNSLEKDVLSGINVLLYAPRRFGKTSLLLASLKRLKNKGVKGVYIDLFPVSSEEEFLNLYFGAVVFSLEGSVERVIRTIRETLKFKPSFSVNVDSEGRTSFRLDFGRVQKDKTFEEVIDLPFRYAEKRGSKLCVVLDEFQEIYRLGLEAKLRSAVQKHSRKVSYLFSGSRKSILEKMFSDRREPFYRSVKKVSLNPIGEKEWIPFIRERFERTGKSIPVEFIEEGVKLLEGHPQGVQEFFHFLWEETDKVVDRGSFLRAMDKLLETEKDTFWFMWEELTNIQRKVLKLIAYTDGVEVYRRENLERFSLSANSVQKAVGSLIEKDVIERKGKKLVFQNPIVKLWLRRELNPSVFP
ncbi:ATP-binding protein [Hydrogenivirga sp. 128-5-R1-1]|uniref:AAA family ATPase n=1 Tax=Hydrogenivirga sp. 128-5-R1-1 TaxID=392423 RepID=UPI00015EF76E|nr:ATP-binding protein [Hydrogenivirga sp. 128-5-R1-1]EDP75560.1 archaeal ATPase [Hydrogenivirga sp. 128-5-R1-1]